MNSIFGKNNSADGLKRQPPEDADAIADQLVRLERLADSLHDTLCDLKLHDVQLSMQFEKQLEWMQRLEQTRPAGLTQSETLRDTENLDPQSGDETGQFDAAAAGDDTFVQDWQQQRKAMVDRMNQPQAVTVAVEKPVALTSKKNMWDDKPALAGSTSDDQVEIQLLKDQLKKAIRDAEVELSVERARLGNDKLQIEKTLNDLEQREKEIALRESSSSSTGSAVEKSVGRFKKFLTRRKNA